MTRNEKEMGKKRGLDGSTKRKGKEDREGRGRKVEGRKGKGAKK